MEIKLLTSVFQSKGDFQSDMIIPVSAGAKLYQNHVLTEFRDDTGENISEKNSYYCELTVHYWAWKNLKADYYGLMHQRRYFEIKKSLIYTKESEKLSVPYRIYDKPDLKLVSEILNKNTLENILKEYQIIAPLRENIYRSVKEYYQKSDQREFDDIALIFEIIKDLSPEYLKYANLYFNHSYSYFCNMFIMDKKNFQDYSEWLFKILFEYERRKPKEFLYPREMGKIAERLFGVWFDKIIAENKVSWAEFPRAHFKSVNGVTAKNLSFNPVFYKIFPPGTKRKALLWNFKR